MATLTKKPARVVSSISGNQPQVRVYRVDAAVELFGGDFVAQASATDGDLVRAATPIAADDLLLGLLLHAVKEGTGWHLKDKPDVNTYGGGTFGGTFMGATNLLGSLEGIGGHVALANADSIFELGADSAAGSAAEVVGEQVGVIRDVAGDDANIWEVDEDSATNSAVIVAIPNYPDEVPGTDLNARVWIQFIAAASALF